MQLIGVNGDGSGMENSSQFPTRSHSSSVISHAKEIVWLVVRCNQYSRPFIYWSLAQRLLAALNKFLTRLAFFKESDVHTCIRTIMILISLLLVCNQSTGEIISNPSSIDRYIDWLINLPHPTNPLLKEQATNYNRKRILLLVLRVVTRL